MEANAFLLCVSFPPKPLPEGNLIEGGQTTGIADAAMTC